jgi:hypothetical protein
VERGLNKRIGRTRNNKVDDAIKFLSKVMFSAVKEVWQVGWLLSRQMDAQTSMIKEAIGGSELVIDADAVNKNGIPLHFLNAVKGTIHVVSSLVSIPF